MTFHLFGLLGGRRPACALSRPTTSPTFTRRLILESLEEREVMSATHLAPPVLQAFQAATVGQQAVAIIPLQVQDVALVGNQLIATLGVGGQTFEVPLDLTLINPGGGACPILDLEIGAINLDVLGLDVQTSDICLEITAMPGEGLLGDLLCGVSNLLNPGTFDLGGLLGALGTNVVNGLIDQVIQPALGAGLGQLLSTDSLAGVGVSGTGNSGHAACDILNLSLGPVNLNLLGLQVDLDNCDDGPVTVDITAEPGAGRLLGNLLCGLSGLLDSGASPVAITQRLIRIGNLIDRLV